MIVLLFAGSSVIVSSRIFYLLAFIDNAHIQPCQILFNNILFGICLGIISAGFEMFVALLYYAKRYFFAVLFSFGLSAILLIVILTQNDLIVHTSTKKECESVVVLFQIHFEILGFYLVKSTLVTIISFYLHFKQTLEHI